jgi:hypothetical protein
MYKKQKMRQGSGMVLMKVPVFWNMMPCSLVYKYKRFWKSVPPPPPQCTGCPRTLVYTVKHVLDTKAIVSYYSNI